MKQLVTIAFLTILTLTGMFAQGKQQTQPGAVVVVQDERLEGLYGLYLEQLEENPTIEGYRIQISSSSNRDAIYNVKKDFYTNFPNERPFVIYQQPNFKLRVGSFRTRLEAYNLWIQVKEHFPDAFIVRDNIKVSEL